jgi:hypothetical protein
VTRVRFVAATAVSSRLPLVARSRSHDFDVDNHLPQTDTTGHVGFAGDDLDRQLTEPPG